jgi:hypothetical protein
MMFSCQQRALTFSVLILWVGIILAGVMPTGADSVQDSPSKKKWWPTKVPSSVSFVGEQACAECHVSKATQYRGNSMSRALEHVAESQILNENPSLKFRSQRFSWEIKRKGKQSFYSVTDGQETITEPILYSFGQGKAGQTYVIGHNGEYYEARLSFYNEIHGLDITIGHDRAEPASLSEAFGRRISADETMQCFACHSAGAVRGNNLHLDKLMPGVTCESCHGPGGEHVAAGKAGQPNKDKIFNPGRLSADDLSQEFCASCHRGVEDITVMPQLGGANNVRFQPYRVFSSKCYSDDRRISCIGCHNPHEELRMQTAYYDAKCLSCHNSSTEKMPDCKAGKKENCTSCHMPKIKLEGSHTTFTDHRIRIVKAGEPYPL